MGNMSYCRFENTYKDLQDCQEALQGYGSLQEAFEEVNQYEKRYVKRLVELCKDIVDEFEEEPDSEEDLE